MLVERRNRQSSEASLETNSALGRRARLIVRHDVRLEGLIVGGVLSAVITVSAVRP